MWGIISVQRGHHYELILRHELAHCCDTPPVGRREAAHGWRLTRIYLDLVRRQMDTADALRGSIPRAQRPLQGAATVECRTVRSAGQVDARINAHRARAGNAAPA
ncbi:MAG: hypothetical protein J5I81_08095 [Nitrococcus mobilis]|nr:hypothetical protein [Nitrococcus mobilis]